VIFTPAYSLFSRHVNDQVRRNCVELRTEDWEAQMDMLVDAYLSCALHDDGEGRPMPLPPEDISWTIEINVIDIFCKLF
jgi:hypothetical protein